LDIRNLPWRAVRKIARRRVRVVKVNDVKAFFTAVS